MATKDDVLKLLINSGDTAISGEEIAGKLGISRTAVWKAIKSLRADGCSIAAVTNKGYTLFSRNDTLSAADIVDMLTGDAKEYCVTVFNEIDSTNSYLKSKAASGAKSGTVAVAARQTAGRGRYGRKFVSDNGGLYLSLLIRADITTEQSLFITTAAAVAVSRAIESVCDLEAGIKWVNDIFINGKKVCGILTDGASDFESGKLEYAVVGIGVNVTEPKGGFAPEISDIATSVYGTNAPENAKNRLAAAILNELARVLASPNDKSIASEYRNRSFVIGKKVDIISGDSTICATVQDIDDSAAIILKTDDGQIIRKNSGEIRIRIKTNEDC